LLGTDIYIAIKDQILSVFIPRTYFPITKLTVTFSLFVLSSTDYQNFPYQTVVLISCQSVAAMLYMSSLSNKSTSTTNYTAIASCVIIGSVTAVFYYYFCQHFLHLLSGFVEIPHKRS